MRSRQGTAPLEFVMVLPFLVALFAGIMWVAAVCINQSGAIVGARYKAWAKRGAEKANPFEFGEATQGKLEGSDERPVHVSPLLDDWVTPASEHAVFGGAWDYPHVDLNQSPNWGMCEKFVRKAGQQKLSELKQVTDGFQRLRANGDKFVEREVQEAMVFQNLGARLGPRFTATEQAAADRQADSQRKSETAYKDAHNKVQRAIQIAEGKLSTAKADLTSKQMDLTAARTELDEEEKKSDPDQEKVDKLKKQIQKLETETTELQTRIPEIEQGIDELKKSDRLLGVSQGAAVGS